MSDGCFKSANHSHSAHTICVNNKQIQHFFRCQDIFSIAHVSLDAYTYVSMQQKNTMQMDSLRELICFNQQLFSIMALPELVSDFVLLNLFSTTNNDADDDNNNNDHNSCFLTKLYQQTKRREQQNHANDRMVWRMLTNRK